MRIDGRVSNELKVAVPDRGATGDAAYHALPLLRRLSDSLRVAKRFLDRCRRLNQERERNRGGSLLPSQEHFPVDVIQAAALRDPEAASAWTILPDLLDDAITLLAASRFVRRAARAIAGFKADALACQPEIKACQPLFEILDMPEDETILVIDPAAKIGMRVVTRAVSTVAEFHMLLADIWPFGPKPDRTVIAAYHQLTFGSPAIAKARFQLYHPHALQNRSIDRGFDGSADWIWNDRPLSSIPRISFERTVIVGPPVYPLQWEAERHLPFAVEALQVIDRLDDVAVETWLRLFNSQSDTHDKVMSSAVRKAA